MREPDRLLDLALANPAASAEAALMLPCGRSPAPPRGRWPLLDIFPLLVQIECRCDSSGMGDDAYADWPRRRIFGMVAAATRFGLDESLVLDGTGIAPADLGQPGHRITVEDEFAVVRRLNTFVTADAPLPIASGRGFHWLADGPVGQAVRTSADLLQVHRLVWQAGRDAMVSLWLDATIAPPFVLCTIGDEHLPADVRQFLTVRNLVYLDTGLRELLGRVVRPHSVAIHGRRPVYADALDRHYRLTVTWDAPRTELRVPLDQVSGPLIEPGPATPVRAPAHPGEVSDAYRAGRNLVRETRRLLADGPGQYTMESAALALGVSSRTLRRHLADEATSFRDLLADELSRRAKQLLAAGMPVQKVSAVLGYSEVAAFSRAFKRWTGVAPAQWRRRS
jgi:AraC-like DNA-binding protein